MPNTDTHVQGTCAWVDLMTDNPDASRSFYGSLFGWTWEIGIPESGPYSMAHQNGRRVCGLGPKPAGSPMPTMWNMYLAVDDIDATLAKIKEAGGNVIMGPMTVFDQGKLAYATDPTGGAFGMWQPLSHQGHQLENEPGAYTWTELYTRDLEKASQFLRAVFGYDLVNMDGMPYVTLHLGPDKKTVAGGVMQMNPKDFPPEVPPHWVVYFACEDTDASVEKVKSLGGQVMAPPFDTPYGRISVVQDPQGAVFSLIKLPG